MKKLFLTLACLFLLAGAAYAQPPVITATFVWDASDTVSTPTNPVLYRLYASPNADFSSPSVCEAGVNLTCDMALPLGRSYVWATARLMTIVDGVPSSPFLESEKSNVLTIDIFAAPNKPGRLKLNKAVLYLGGVN